MLQSLVNYPGEQRVALLPSVVRLLLASFVEEIAATDQANRVTKGGADPRDTTREEYP